MTGVYVLLMVVAAFGGGASVAVHEVGKYRGLDRCQAAAAALPKEFTSRNMNVRVTAACVPTS